MSLARAVIAAACLDTLPDATVGSIVLRDDQRLLQARAQRILDRMGGCLIADDVGRGKTFVALAIAKRWAMPLVVVPAALIDLWRDAAQRTASSITVVSHESLSRGSLPAAGFDGIIVDESHHFRNSATRRYEGLSRLVARAPVVLLSATPLQNRVGDLSSQLALFLGTRAFLLDPRSLARFVVRGDDSVPSFLPHVAPPQWIDLHADDSRMLGAILDLPPPARPLDGGDAGALRVISLVRAWASSRAALVAALATRRRRSAAIEQGVAEGRVPTKREMLAWHGADGDVQLGFASLLMETSADGASLELLSRALDDDQRSMESLRAMLDATADPDRARVDALRRLRAEHADERIIAFSEYASTVVALYRAMRGDAGVGVMTARQARIASGVIPRREMLRRFAPAAQRAKASPAHEQVTLLLATDLLSEGVNLQDASVVVHLDLPWNPARLTQRVGRVRRPGGATQVRTYLLAPPARAAELLAADARMRRKLASASQIIGVGFTVLPTDADGLQPHPARSNAALQGALANRLAAWGGAVRCREQRLVVAAAVAEMRGWLAALSDGRLICKVDDRITEEVAAVTLAAHAADGAECVLSCANQREALDELANWVEMDSLTARCGAEGADRRTAAEFERWLASVMSSLRRHERAVGAPLASAIRDAIVRPLPLFAERALLADLAAWRPSTRDHLDHLRRALALIDGAQHFVSRLPSEGTPSVRGLVLFGPDVRLPGTATR